VPTGLLCVMRRIKLLGNVCYASLERDFTLRGVFGNDIGFGSYDMKDYIISQVCLELFEPAPHLFERLWVGDVIAEHCRICSCVRCVLVCGVRKSKGRYGVSSMRHLKFRA